MNRTRNRILRFESLEPRWLRDGTLEATYQLHPLGVADQVARYQIWLDLQPTGLEQLGYFRVDVAGSSANLTGDGQDYSAFSFQPDRQHLPPEWQPLPGADFGLGPENSAVEYAAETALLPGGSFPLGALHVDLAARGLTADCRFFISLKSAGNLVGVERPDDPASFRLYPAQFHSVIHASAGPDRTVDEGDSVVLTGVYTGSQIGRFESYHWTVDADNGQQAPEGREPSFAFTPVDNGQYRVTFTVYGLFGDFARHTATVTVRNVPPHVVAGPDRVVEPGQRLDFAGGFTDPGEWDTHTFHWDFGDGTTADGTLTPSHIYAAAGDYRVTLTVTDNDGGIGRDHLTVTVRDTAPRNRISGSVYLDVNHNGVRESYERGLPGVAITLTGPVHRTTWTGPDGSYRFDDLPDGLYTLTQTQPAAFLAGHVTPGVPRLGRVEPNRFADLPLAGGMDARQYLFAQRGLRYPDKSQFLASTPDPTPQLLEQLTRPDAADGYRLAPVADATVVITLSPPGAAGHLRLYTESGLPVVPDRPDELHAPLIGGAVYRLQVEADEAVVPTIEFHPYEATGGGEFHNAAQPPDVSGDGHVTPRDALLLVNELNHRRIVDRQGRFLIVPAEDSTWPHFDVNGDGHLTPADVLQVINTLNATRTPVSTRELVPPPEPPSSPLTPSPPPATPRDVTTDIPRHPHSPPPPVAHPPGARDPPQYPARDEDHLTPPLLDLLALAICQPDP